MEKNKISQKRIMKTADVVGCLEDLVKPTFPISTFVLAAIGSEPSKFKSLHLSDCMNASNCPIFHSKLRI